MDWQTRIVKLVEKEYLIRVKSINTAAVDFEIYEIQYRDEKDNTSQFMKKEGGGYDAGSYYTSAIEEAECLIKGFIKFDGCMHMYFAPDDEDNKGYIHVCEPSSSAALGVVLLHAYEMSSHLMDSCMFLEDLSKFDPTKDQR